jgi:hypothetical protein
MLDTENDPLVPIDPPDNTGGGEADLDPDAASADARTIDPPDNTGGGK